MVERRRLVFFGFTPLPRILRHILWTTRDFDLNRDANGNFDGLGSSMRHLNDDPAAKDPRVNLLERRDTLL
jgi:hypothetical protein